MLYFILITFLSAYVTGLSLPGQNTPPVISLHRDWKIPENEEVGTKIESARATDVEGDELVFDIKPSEYLDGSKYFRVDPQSGDIYLNRSLQGKAGAQYYLFVTAKDHEFESKTEVLVDVDSATGRTKHASSSRMAPTIVRPTVPLPKDIVFGFTRHPTHTPFAFTRHPPITIPPPESVEHNLHFNRIQDSSSIQVNATEPNVVISPPVISASGETEQSQSSPIAAAVAPIAALIGLIPLVVAGLWFARRSHKLKNAATATVDDKKRTENETTVSTCNLQESEFVTSSLPRAQSNKYEATEWESVDRSPDVTQDVCTDSKWEYPRHRLKIFGILGEGCFGQVWKCETEDIGGLTGTSTVAVKTLKENAGEREKRDLLSELEVMKMLDPHPNIVRLLGCCIDKEPLFVIMEYVPHGKLQTYLRNSRAEHYYGNLHGSSKHLTSRDLTSFAYHVARGMEYLSSKGVIHRDLAARNVLVGHNKTCKVADFGFARDVVVNRIYERKSEGRLPIRWMAPESLYDNIFSSKTDVWSFGVLLWEIVTLGSTPYPGMAAGDVIKKIRDGYRLEKPDHCKRELYNIMYYCWAKDSKERPSFVELAQTLEKLLLGDVDYIELEHFPEHAYYNVVSLSGEKL